MIGKLLRRGRLWEPMPDKFNALATYNSEVSRGLIHYAAWINKMSILQSEFNVWQAEQVTKEERGYTI
jgi:hypothetical protein